MPILKLHLNLLLIITSVVSYGQLFKNEKLTKSDIMQNIVAAYSAGNFEVTINYTFFKDKSFKYHQFGPLGYEDLSSGKWLKVKNTYILNSYIDSNNVPIEVRLIDDTSQIRQITGNHPYKNIIPKQTIFWIPLNLKSEALPDSRIFINNASTYCFPYFDTCINQWKNIDSLKVDFGDGFKSSWHSIPKRPFKKILCIAKVNVIFSRYVSYKNHRFRIVAKGIEPLD